MKVFTGQVTAKKMNKTATVEVDRVMMHPVYKKRYKQTKKYHVHDEVGTKVGDKVNFVATKPYSKLKKWRITKVLKGDLPDSKSDKAKKVKKEQKKSSKKR